MVNNNEYTNSENIHVKVDQNNLVYIDPNSVLDSSGEVQPRGHKQENLVMYVNLEADLIPRTSLISDDNSGNTLTEIAKGNLNFLKNASGDGNFDSTWTDSFLPKPIEGQETTYFDTTQFKDPSGQTFGIDSVSISVRGANFVPQVSINFIDVRGKTLFESSENSPYKAFFHLPWPIFYLTVKGYYGKAIRYRLHMTNFSSRYNESNGNFEISTTFVGSTFAWLNDIPLSAIINCPYMFITEEPKDETFNEKTGLYEKRIKYSSRGYNILKSVYNEYKNKGLIPRDFPVRTLKEMGYIAESLDKILEQEIFGLVGVDVFQGIKEIDDLLNLFEETVQSWARINLSREYTTFLKKNQLNEENREFWFYLKNKTTETKIIGEETGSLEKILKDFNDRINNSKIFTQNLLKPSQNKSGESFVNQTSGDFTKITLKKTKEIRDYIEKLDDEKYVVYIDGIYEDIYNIRKSFEEQRKKVEDDIETKMNQVIKGKDGFGFEPTIRNMFAVLLANADVYIRLMKDVHNRAFIVSNERKNLLTNLSKESKGENIYPWPEIKKPQFGGKENVLSYPGEEQLIPKLKSNNKQLWPEVDFVEEFVNITTNRTETNVNNEPTRNNVNYVFESDSDSNNIEDLFGIDVITESVPYLDKTYSGFLYELYERARYLTMFDSFNDVILTELANEEFKNIKESIKFDNDLISFVKGIGESSNPLLRLVNINSTSVENGNNGPITTINYGGLLHDLSPFEKFNFVKDNLPTTNYIISGIEEPFKFESYIENSTSGSGDLDDDKLNVILKDYFPESYRKNIYPFNSTTYLNYLNKNNFSDDNFKFGGILKFDSSKGLVVSPISVSSWLKPEFNNPENLTSGNIDFFSNTVKISNNDVPILNTPYFHNQLYSDFNKLTGKGKYVGSSYLMLNSLPFIDLDEEITFGNDSILTSSLFREISSTHFIPYHLMLKWGSIYHRYKKHLIDGVDILDGSIDSTYTVRPLSGKTLFDNDSQLITFNSLNTTSVDETITVPSTLGMVVGMKLIVTSIGNGQFDNETTVIEIINSTTFIVSKTPLTPLINATIYGVYDEKNTFKITPRVSTTNGDVIGVTYTPYVDIISGVTEPELSNIYNDYTNVGVNPHYQSIFSQIVNGFSTYNNNIGNPSYELSVISKGIIHRNRKKTNRNYWDVIVDNSIYNSLDKKYTLLPSVGDFEDFKIKDDNTLSFSQELSFRTLWYTDDIIVESFNNKTFPTPYDYFKTMDNKFSISTNYKKALDLIGTFSPQILEYFESFFIDFSSQKMNDEIPYEIFRNIKYSKFQDILRKLTVVEKLNNDTTDIDLLIKNNLKQRQRINAQQITKDILSPTNLIKFTLANPKEIDPFTLYGFTRVNNLSTYQPGVFDINDVNQTNLNLIKLYIGEDIDNHYLNFFNVNNIRLNEENIKTHRSIIQIYAGYIKSGGVNTKLSFIEYLTNEIILKNSGSQNIANGIDRRMNLFISLVLKQLSKLNSSDLTNNGTNINFFKGHNTDQIKLELYNTFKSFNDKWTSGNSIGQRLLLEEFLFLDKANRDIGNNFYLNIDKFLPILSPKNSNKRLYDALSMLISGTGLDMRALPSYVNFYGNNLVNKNKITPSKKLASNIFGTFLEVDYQESTPKVIIQFVGQSSKRLDMTNSKPNKFMDDSFYVGNTNNNPIFITDLKSFTKENLSNSNRAVAFEVSFGDQNQGIFKGITLDQKSLKNTSESFGVLENLARSASGAGTYNIDVSLFDLYKTQSYTCGVSSMGNVMIQPTMYFYLKNVPMFKGTYWITEVNHEIKSNTITTTFSGTRIPFSSLPDPRDSFAASYRVLFDKIQSKAIGKFKQRQETKTDTQEVVIFQNVPYITDRGGVIINGETPLTQLKDVGINKFGVPFNGANNERTIQLIENNGVWLRALAVQIDGKEYSLSPTVSMNIANGIDFSTISNSNNNFYMTKFQLSKSITDEVVRSVKTTFRNPKNNKEVIVNPNYQLDPNIGPISVQGPIAVGPSIEKYGIALSKNLMNELKLKDGDVVYFRME
jgi:hypothetical protein